MFVNKSLVVIPKSQKDSDAISFEQNPENKSDSQLKTDETTETDEITKTDENEIPDIVPQGNNPFSDSSFFNANNEIRTISKMIRFTIMVSL